MITLFAKITNQMGSSSSKTGSISDVAGSSDDGCGGQLYVSLKLRNVNLKTDLVPHVYGSVPLIGSWDSVKAVRNIHTKHFQQFDEL